MNETVPAEEQVAPTRATEFTAAEHAMLDALGAAPDRGARALLFREMVRTGLDPFARHIYIQAKKDKQGRIISFGIETYIDGFRVVAATQPTYRGQTAVQWCGTDGQWRDIWVAPEKDWPYAARVGVYVDGYREPIWGTAILREYRPAGGATFMWDKMPSLMIGKVAEALALRKAYPAKLSGIYTNDEMAQSATADEPQRLAQQQDRDAETPDRPAQRQQGRVEDEWTTPVPPSASSEQFADILGGLTVVRGITDSVAKAAAVCAMVGREITHPSQITAAEAETILATLRAEQEAKQSPKATDRFTPDNPGITRPQMTMLHATFGEKGITDRADKLAFAARIIGHPLESSEHLTKAEAHRVIDALNTGEIPRQPDPTPFALLSDRIKTAPTSDALADVTEAAWTAKGNGALTDAEHAAQIREAREAVPA
jgi:phage recombination protein Bet